MESQEFNMSTQLGFEPCLPDFRAQHLLPRLTFMQYSLSSRAAMSEKRVDALGVKGRLGCHLCLKGTHSLVGNIETLINNYAKVDEGNNRR